jgi:hypothetical protein
MLVIPSDLDIQVAFGCIRKGFEEVEKHFCGHITHFFSGELGLPYQPGPSSKID